jgi:hypothetical protein
MRVRVCGRTDGDLGRDPTEKTEDEQRVVSKTTIDNKTQEETAATAAAAADAPLQ